MNAPDPTTMRPPLPPLDALPRHMHYVPATWIHYAVPGDPWPEHVARPFLPFFGWVIPTEEC